MIKGLIVTNKGEEVRVNVVGCRVVDTCMDMAVV
jgi:hypothetical protein